MSELWDLKHTSEQPNCNVANISLRFEGEILEIFMFTFFVLYLDQLLIGDRTAHHWHVSTKLSEQTMANLYARQSHLCQSLRITLSRVGTNG